MMTMKDLLLFFIGFSLHLSSFLTLTKIVRRIWQKSFFLRIHSFNFLDMDSWKNMFSIPLQRAKQMELNSKEFSLFRPIQNHYYVCLDVLF